MSSNRSPSWRRVRGWMRTVAPNVPASVSLHQATARSSQSPGSSAAPPPGRLVTASAGPNTSSWNAGSPGSGGTSGTSVRAPVGPTSSDEG